MLATKFHGRMGEGPNREGNSRRWIMSECEDSLRRLKTDYIDLYQIHRPSPEIDIDETLSALSDLVHAGKIRYFGSSTFPAWMVVDAHCVSERRSRERLSTEQPPYSMLVRAIEERPFGGMPRIAAWACSAGAPWPAAGSPAIMARGSKTRAGGRPGSRPGTTWTTRPTKPSWPPSTSWPNWRTKPVTACPSWPSLSSWPIPAVTSAIIGPRTMEQLTGVLAAADITLDDAILDRIDEIVPPGRNINSADGGWVPPWVSDPSRRRRR